MHKASLIPLAKAGALLSLVAAQAPSQCSLQLQPPAGAPGVEGASHEVRGLGVWDQDGAGGAPPKLVVGGFFTTVGGMPASNVAVYDPTTLSWSALGSGLNGGAGVFATMPNGDLVVGGSFTTAGGVVTNNIARWDGTAWSAFGSGMDSDVYALSVLPNGDLIAGGAFTTAGGVACGRIARWDGTAWSPFGLGANDIVRCVLPLANGDFFVGGNFTSIDGVSLNRLARCSAGVWSHIGVDGANDTVYAMTLTAGGDLIVGGSFTGIDGVLMSRIARWNGATWAPIGVDGVNDHVFALAVLPNGDLVVGGALTSADGVVISRLARWDGASWSAFGGGIYAGPGSGTGTKNVHALALLPNGDLFVGGDFIYVDGSNRCLVNSVARRDGASWTALGPGFNSNVAALLTLANGEVIAAGGFNSVDGAVAEMVARWNGANWSATGSGFFGVGNVVALTQMANGDLIAGGYFSGGTNGIARWDGTTWSPLGGGLNASVNAMVVLPDGDLVVSATILQPLSYRIMRWDGASWSQIGALDSQCMGLAVVPGGNLAATGFFTSVDGVPVVHAARWDGITWSPMNLGSAGEVGFSLVTAPNGQILMGTNVGVRTWTGSSWDRLGSLVGPVFAVKGLPNGDVLASNLGVLARWDGSTWAGFSSVTGQSIQALALGPTGDLFVGGNFDSVQGQPAFRFARWSAPCPALVAPVGVGCPSSGGNNTLVGTTPPWTGATFRARGTGLPLFSFVFSVLGVSPVPQGLLPLGFLLAAGQPGCDLLVTPDALELVLASFGTVDTALAIPNSPSLAGAVLYQQLIPIEVDANLNFTAITATNALQVTIGTL